MKLQLAFDLTDLDKAISIAKELSDEADIIEIGTLLIYKNGTDAIKQFKDLFPQKIILADAKIIDRGKDSTSLFINAGADWVTVMAGTSKNVIHTACATAHELGKKIMLDMLDAASAGQSALDAKSLGADALVFHRASDDQEKLQFLENWDMVRGNTPLPIFISGTFTKDTVHEIVPLNPDGLIISISATTSISRDDLVAFHQAFEK